MSLISEEDRDDLANSEAALRAAHREFYQALGSCSVHGMEQIWSKSESAICIHPGWPPLLGWEKIRKSWVNIFRNTHMHEMKTEIISIQVANRLGWILCVEQIGVLKDAGMSISYSLTTNIFEFLDNWRIIVHHSSPFYR